MGKRHKQRSVGSVDVQAEEKAGHIKDSGKRQMSTKHIPFLNPITQRKERRKEKRRLKKSRRFAFSQRTEMPTISRQETEKKLAAIAEKKRAKKRKKKAKIIQKKIDARKQRQEERKEKKLEEQGQKLAIAKEEREIRDLEKKLNMKKSRTTLPQSFINDGLDYLFEALDSHGKDSSDNLDSGQCSGSESDEMDEEILSGSEGEESEEDLEDIFDRNDSEMDNSDSESDSGRHVEVVTSTSEPKPKSILKAKSTDKNKSDSKSLKWKENDGVGEDERDEESDEETVSSVKENSKKLKRKKDMELDSDSDSDKDEHEILNKRKTLKVIDGKDKTLKNVKQTQAEIQKASKGVENVGKKVKLPKGNEKDDSEMDDSDDDGDENDISLDVHSDSDDDDDGDGDGDDGSGGDDEELHEDIYGRTLDKAGNVVQPRETGAYIPPAKRAQMAGDSGKRKLMLERLKKQLKGLINRASESNMQPISSQIEELYMSNSRADVNEILTGLMLDSCVSPILTPERLCQELAMLVAILHGNVGMEVGAFFLQNLAKRFEAKFQSCGHSDSKEMDNIILVLANLYNFKIVQSALLFDIARKFVKRFGEKDIELILLLLKSAGFSLRKEDPNSLKDLILEVQTAAGTVDTTNFQDKSRVRFMLEVLLAIKNNNMRKIPNYDPEHLEHLRKLIRNYIRNGSFGSNQLNIGLEDLMKAEERGRWWVVGSAWGGRDQNYKGPAATPMSTSNVAIAASKELTDLARKQRMNTDIRKTIFYAIMTSEDYIDAFEKLIKLGLKHQQEREIIHVIMDCCLQEKKFNPYYAYLAQKFCEFDRRFQMTIQFNLWDKFKEMGSISQLNRENLASLISHLLLKKGLSLSILKVVEFGTLEKPMVRFLKSLLITVLMAANHREMESVFERIAPLDKLRHLQEGLKLFMKHFLLRGKGTLDADKMTELSTRLKVAEKALSLGQNSMLL